MMPNLCAIMDLGERACFFATIKLLPIRATEALLVGF